MDEDVNSQSYRDYFDPSNFYHWQLEHQHAFFLDNLNFFFFFFHKTDEKLYLSVFSTEENTLFLNNLLHLCLKKNVNQSEMQGNWGLFSLCLPYRNGVLSYKHYLSLKHSEKKNDFEKIVNDYLNFYRINTRENYRKFIDFFNNLEPGYLNTNNHQDFLNILDINQGDLKRKVTEIKAKIQISQKGFEKLRNYKVICEAGKLKEWILEQNEKIPFVEKPHRKKKKNEEENTIEKLNRKLKIEEEDSDTFVFMKNIKRYIIYLISEN